MGGFRFALEFESNFLFFEVWCIRGDDGKEVREFVSMWFGLV
jgi:hypothetical protein